MWVECVIHWQLITLRSQCKTFFSNASAYRFASSIDCSAAVARTFSNWNGNSRRGRQSKLPSTLDPAITTSALLRAYDEVNNEAIGSSRYGKSVSRKSANANGCVAAIDWMTDWLIDWLFDSLLLQVVRLRTHRRHNSARATRQRDSAKRATTQPHPCMALAWPLVSPWQLYKNFPIFCNRWSSRCASEY